MNKQVIIMVAIGAVIIGGGTYLAVKEQNVKPPPAQIIDQNILVHADSHIAGNPAAKATLVEFGDFQCPACAAAYPIVKPIVEKYQSQLRFVFRNYPLPMHPNAPMAAEAAEAAGAQGKYWEMVDKLYTNQTTWADQKNPLETFAGYAKDLGLNVDQFKSEVSANKYADRISHDQLDGSTASVNATPTFFINGVAYVGVPGQDFAGKLAAAIGQ
jgi:protein-disulfide isomerase